MSADLKDRELELAAEALRVNAGRKPKFGDLMRNPWASEGNPKRDGYFVRSKRTTGRFNPGLWYEFTDRNGEFWETSGQYAVFVAAVDHEAPEPCKYPACDCGPDHACGLAGPTLSHHDRRATGKDSA
jgi:hypothetical protein